MCIGASIMLGALAFAAAAARVFWPLCVGAPPGLHDGLFWLAFVAGSFFLPLGLSARFYLRETPKQDV